MNKRTILVQNTKNMHPKFALAPCWSTKTSKDVFVSTV